MIFIVLYSTKQPFLLSYLLWQSEAGVTVLLVLEQSQYWESTH